MTSSAFGDFDVRLDPWAAEYAGELPLETDAAEPTEDVDLNVERPAEAWSAVTPARGEPPMTVIFVDGVRRVEGRLLARRDQRLIHGVIGSFGVGAVRVEDGQAACCDEPLQRNREFSESHVETDGDPRCGAGEVAGCATRRSGR